MTITLEARNYRALRWTRWTPSGVCVVVGPNGSGKTTLLGLFDFLRVAYRRGMSAAVDSQGGAWGLRHFQAQPEDYFGIGIAIGDLWWTLQLSIRGASVDPRPGEGVFRGVDPRPGEGVFRGADGGPLHRLLNRAPSSNAFTSTFQPGTLSWDDDRLALRYAADAIQAPELKPLTEAIEAFRFYRSYNIFGLRRNGSLHNSDQFLNSSGENVFSVLRNWRDRRDGAAKYDFVIRHLRAAFPEVFTDLQFEGAGQTISASLFQPRFTDPVPLYFAPNGWVTSLLHLCAVAGAQPGSLVAIDEMENTLHPFAIRKLMEAFREWAEEHDVTICLATHSPVVLDQFKEDPENVFVMEPGQPTLPVRLTDLNDPEWLAQFSLGDLYSHGDFGSPSSALPKSEPAK